VWGGVGGCGWVGVAVGGFGVRGGLGCFGEGGGGVSKGGWSGAGQQTLAFNRAVLGAEEIKRTWRHMTSHWGVMCWMLKCWVLVARQ